MNTTVSHANNLLRLAYTVTTTTNCHTTGPRVSKDANRNMCLLLSTPNTRQIVFFFKLTIHHNNKNIWYLANRKNNNNSDAGGDEKLNKTFFYEIIY